MDVGVVVEGTTDYPVAEKLVSAVGRQAFELLIARGKPNIDSRLARWNQPSNRLPMLVLRDWDADDGVDCVPELMATLAPNGLRARGLAIRVPVRSTEAWLLADHEAVKQFFSINAPVSPDDLANPKEALVNLCRKSKRAQISRDMVPTPKAMRRVGPLYEATLIEFGREHWRVEAARTRSPSLDRAVRRLELMVAAGQW